MNSRKIFALGLLLFLTAGVWNIGFIATDDYTNGIEIMVPAQATRDIHTLATYTHNPFTPRLLMYGLAKCALKLGIQSPANQVRFVFACIGLYGFIISFFALASILELYSDERKELRKRIGLALYSFYFLCPLFSSRALVESFALPYLVLGMALATRYSASRQLRYGLLSLTILALGSTMRFQLGILAPLIFLIPVLIKEYRHLFSLTLLGLLLFAVTGLYDGYFTGSFHGGLKSYFFYNLHSVGDLYGRQPFYVFILLFVGLSLPPTFIKRWKGFNWRTEYSPLLVSLIAFILFVALHSFSPHKEERFMIPVLPLFLLLLTPLLTELYIQKAWKRLGYFVGLNFFLLFFTTVEIPQKNIIFLMTYLDQHPEFENIIGAKDTLVIYPKAFLRKDLTVLDTRETPDAPAKMDCKTVFAVREDLLPTIASSDLALKPVAKFSPGLLESLVVKMNPKYNFRRAAITLFKKSDCPT